MTCDHHVIIHGCCLVILLLHSFFCFQTTGLVAFLVVSKSKSLTVCNSQYCFQYCSTEWWSAELADCLDSPLISAGFQVMWLFQVSWHYHKLKWLLFNNKKKMCSACQTLLLYKSWYHKINGALFENCVLTEFVRLFGRSNQKLEEM